MKKIITIREIYNFYSSLVNFTIILISNYAINLLFSIIINKSDDIDNTMQSDNCYESLLKIKDNIEISKIIIQCNIVMVIIFFNIHKYIKKHSNVDYVLYLVILYCVITFCIDWSLPMKNNYECKYDIGVRSIIMSYLVFNILTFCFVLSFGLMTFLVCLGYLFDLAGNFFDLIGNIKITCDDYSNDKNNYKNV